AKAGPGSMSFPPKQAESNVLAPNTEATVPRARSTTARGHPGPATGAGADALRTPAPSTDAAPSCRVWATAGNGVAALEITTAHRMRAVRPGVGHSRKLCVRPAVHHPAHPGAVDQPERADDHRARPGRHGRPRPRARTPGAPHLAGPAGGRGAGR